MFRGNLLSAVFFLFLLNLFPLFPASELSFDNSTGKSDKLWYAVTFMSLKTGNSIGPFQFQLHKNGFFEIAMEKEHLSDLKGTYHINRAIFDATAKFRIKRKKRCKYSLSFKGIAIYDMYYTGIARLTEYIEGNKLTQELPFLFFATRKTSDKTGKKIDFF